MTETDAKYFCVFGIHPIHLFITPHEFINTLESTQIVLFYFTLCDKHRIPFTSICVYNISLHGIPLVKLPTLMGQFSWNKFIHKSVQKFIRSRRLRLRKILQGISILRRYYTNDKDYRFDITQFDIGCDITVSGT